MSLKILVIDEETNRRGGLVKRLRAGDHKVEQADSGLAGVREMTRAGKENPFDLIMFSHGIWDVELDAFMKIVRDNNDTATTVIMFTRNPQTSRCNHAVDVGMEVVDMGKLETNIEVIEKL